MMQDTNRDFDLYMRSIMGNAQEEVPSRVWNRVSARLDEKAAPAFAWWQKAAVAVAAAAAIVAGVVYLGTTRDNSTQPHINTIAVVETPRTEEQKPAALLADIPTTRQERVTVKDVTPSTVAVPAAEAEETIPAAHNPETKIEEPVAPVTDPFENLPSEEKTRSRKSGISVTAGASVGSNGNPKEGTFGMKRTSALPGAPRKELREVGKSSTFALPVTAGISVRFDLGYNWAIGTGLNWTMLERNFNGTYSTFKADGTLDNEINGDIKHTLHYIGLPVNVFYNILSGESTRFYAFAGGTFEKAVSNRYRIPASTGNLIYKENVNGIQFSAAAGFGVEFLLKKNFGLYFDPSIRYYFDCKQPTSIRTQQPLMLNLELGLRFDF